ncbi:hypothetical protein, conserved [Eimeria tenella]|uniref:Uncharacterized protein n=1 Tax=Eimeria tenella TaxID=5802 RepID=U6KKR9_EIMTE|nr:hypothetical protein, conserved [Eimeria tenella]CDJ38717.1 hypothetical protein, conserved [Eimeria tenella]|eukprot:XP_013229473.1 hypothetical protein, conserved [Eimeria tenella]
MSIWRRFLSLSGGRPLQQLMLQQQQQQQLLQLQQLQQAVPFSSGKVVLPCKLPPGFKMTAAQQQQQQQPQSAAAAAAAKANRFRIAQERRKRCKRTHGQNAIY